VGIPAGRTNRKTHLLGSVQTLNLGNSFSIGNHFSKLVDFLVLVVDYIGFISKYMNLIWRERQSLSISD
jgi:hypothetical protein